MKERDDRFCDDFVAERSLAVLDSCYIGSIDGRRDRIAGCEMGPE